MTSCGTVSLLSLGIGPEEKPWKTVALSLRPQVTVSKGLGTAFLLFPSKPWNKLIFQLLTILLFEI